MARYINLDEAIKHLNGDCKAKYPLSYSVGLSAAVNEISKMPTADVVPKSEEGAECPTCHGTGRIGTTDWLTKNISKEQLAKEKAEAIAEHELHIKQDYAKEIFEEIEEGIKAAFAALQFERNPVHRKVKNETYSSLMRFVMTVEKKYTEGEE